MQRYIVSLGNRSALDETCSGGKGANLSRMMREGFAVPPGFVITPKAFHDWMAESNGPSISLHRIHTEAELEQARARLLTATMPPPIARAIVRAYRRMGGRVAVRSSLLGEDTQTASFAGQLDSLLNVEGEDAVLDAVKRCWVAIFNPRLLAYLNDRQEFAPAELSLAVVIQRMVAAVAAGVAFSADPLTGQRCVSIEAVHGLADALVQGRAEPDRYLVDARGVLAEAKPADPAAPALENQQTLELAAIVRRLAGLRADPQDVEWAWDGARFYLLQARPVSSLVGRPIYSNRIVSDMVPGLIKPLVWSTNIVDMAETTFGRFFTELTGPNDIDFRQLIMCIHSRMYINVGLFGELFERLGLPANLFDMIARDEQAKRWRPPWTWGLTKTGWRLIRFILRYAKVANEVDAFLERHHREMTPYRTADWALVDADELQAQMERLRELHKEAQWFVKIGSISMLVRKKMLDRLVRASASEVVPSDLIRGLVGLKALEPNKRLAELGALAATLGPDILRLLLEGEDQAIRVALSGSSASRALAAAVDSFMDRYGFLSTNGTDFTATPWHENPTLIWHAIGRFAANPASPAAETVSSIREEAQKLVRSRLNWPKRLIFDRLLRTTIAYIDLRERTSTVISEDAYQMRRIFLALGDRLVAQGALDQREDVFFLPYDDVRELVQGEAAEGAARGRVAAQRAQLAADALFEPPDTVLDGAAPARCLAPEVGDYLVGISGSSGIASGCARLITDPTLAPLNLSRDDILVVPFTDVGWTPLFSGIGGIVAQTGGQLSHTAIVAREYGLPAVVSVKKAMSLIKEGQPITIDGGCGRIYLRHLAQQEEVAI